MAVVDRFFFIGGCGAINVLDGNTRWPTEGETL